MGGIVKNLEAGECISTDQYVSGTPGRLPHAFGREPSTSQFSGGSIYYDHASKLIRCVNQVSLAAGETLKGKHSFELWARLEWLYDGNQELCTAFSLSVYVLHERRT